MNMKMKMFQQFQLMELIKLWTSDIKIQICFICKKVARCHELFKDDSEEIMVCEICDLE